MALERYIEFMEASRAVPLSREELTDIIKAAADRLCFTQSDIGSFVYRYNPVLDRVDNSDYSIVRMAGVAYSLAWAGQYFAGTGEGRRNQAAAASAVRFLDVLAKVNHPNYFVSNFSHERGVLSKASTGSSALLLNALLYAPLFPRHTAEVRLLVKTLELSQLPSGAFCSDPNFPNVRGSQRYYPGEALLALVRYVEVTGDVSVVSKLEIAFVFYEAYWSVDNHQSMVLWHVDAWTRVALLLHRKKIVSKTLNSTSCLDLCRKMVTYILSKSRITDNASFPDAAYGAISSSPSPGISTALYLEAVVRYVQALKNLHLPDDEFEYREIVARAVVFVSRLQIKPAEAEKFPNSSLAVGGFRNHIGSWQLRMDNDQHAITACLSVLECDAT